MSEIRTAEEYVLAELERKELELEECKKKLKEAEEKLVELSTKDTGEDLIDAKCIYLSDKPNTFFVVNTTGIYNWDKILEHNNKDIEFVKKALEDDDTKRELCGLSNGVYTICDISKRYYDYLLVDCFGRDNAICIRDNSSYGGNYMYEINGKSCFHTYEEAIAYVFNEINDSINDYLDRKKKEEEKGE